MLVWMLVILACDASTCRALPMKRYATETECRAVVARKVAEMPTEGPLADGVGMLCIRVRVAA